MITNAFYGISFLTREVGKRFLKIDLYDGTFTYRYDKKYLSSAKLPDKHTVRKILERYGIKENEFFIIKPQLRNKS